MASLLPSLVGLTSPKRMPRIKNEENRKQPFSFQTCASRRPLGWCTPQKRTKRCLDSANTMSKSSLLLPVVATAALLLACLPHPSLADPLRGKPASTTTFPLPSDHTACHNGDTATNSSRVCDVNGLLVSKAIGQLEAAIADLETMNNVTCHNQVLDVQMGIYIVDSVCHLCILLCVCLCGCCVVLFVLTVICPNHCLSSLRLLDASASTWYQLGSLGQTNRNGHSQSMGHWISVGMWRYWSAVVFGYRGSSNVHVQRQSLAQCVNR